MKIRNGFVTNSSSSSYVISYKVNFDDLEEVLKTIKTEFGTKGLYSLFSDVRTSSGDQVVFASGKNLDIEYLFESLPSNLYDTDERMEEW